MNLRLGVGGLSSMHDKMRVDAVMYLPFPICLPGDDKMDGDDEDTIFRILWGANLVHEVDWGRTYVVRIS